MPPSILLPPTDLAGLPPPVAPDLHPRIQLQEPPRSSAVEYLARSMQVDAAASKETPLLQAVKGALRGRDTDPPSSIQTSWFHDVDNPDGREISWNGKQVTLSSGGVMIKRWSFFNYKEDVQYACLGTLEQNALEAQKYFTPAPTAASVSEDDVPWNPSQTPEEDNRPTFGPFTESQRTSKKRKFSDGKKAISAVFIFLRSIGKIYLQNGIDYTINIPFVVRRAWPLSPHGVLVQRVLEASELEEASITGEPVLPTIFSITSPFQEPAAVGLASRIEGGPGSDGAPLVIHAEDEKSSAGVLKAISPTEMILWASHGPESQDIHPDRERNKSLVVTVDPKRNKVSIWAYAYSPDSLPTQQPAPSAPDPATAAVLSQVKSRPSGVISHGRRTSSVFEADRLDSKHSTQNLFPTQEAGPGLNADGFPLVTGIASSLSTVATFPSMTSVPGTSKPKIEKLLPESPDERMRANYWMECILEVDIPPSSAQWWRIMKASVFDERFDGKIYRSRLAICFRDLVVVHIFNIAYDSQCKRFRAIHSTQYPGMAIASVIATRPGIEDLMIVTAEARVYLVSDGGVYSINLIDASVPPDTPYVGCHVSKQGLILDLDDVRGSFLSVVYQNGWVARANVNIIPTDDLTLDCLRILSRALPSPLFVPLHCRFLTDWSLMGRPTDSNIQFDCFEDAVISLLNHQKVAKPTPSVSYWNRLGASTPHAKYKDDVALRQLKLPPTRDRRSVIWSPEKALSPWHGPAVFALHSLGEALRLQQQRHLSLVRLASLICTLALPIRPEWADYWKRLLPDAIELWPDPSRYDIQKVEDRLPTWPQDACAYIHTTLLHNRDGARTAWKDISYITNLYKIDPPFTFGSQDPLKVIADTTNIYLLLSGPESASIQKRAENAVQWLLESGPGLQILDELPLGIASPIREAVRTCQLAPPADWPVHMYTRIGRNDLAASASDNPEWMMTEGYRPAKDFMNPTKAKPSVGKIISDAKAAAAGEVDATSGVDMEDNHVGGVRFKEDRRLDEIARMLNSSTISTIKVTDKPEQSEHDSTKEHQNHLVRVSERTLSLPYGRAMYTYASVTKVTRESHAVPKIEYSIKIVPLNITVTPEQGKIAPEAMHWGEFHNGVAAGLRIAPTAKGVESSWIAFNKPSELTPEHAGFLFALGLTGHLKELMTWHTFQYLTPKHDLTSIAVLLGLAASHIGKGTQKVVKLIAVHTPALLPVPNVDLNVSLLTQTAGLSALGLLYMGMKNRRMAEVCLGEISRKDLVQQDLSNEHREAYTFSAAIAFGMIMLGKGSLIPADLDLVHRLTILLHGDVTLRARDKPMNPFDINLTSPAAAIALGLMYLKTNRQDIADTLTIPDTAVLLNRIPPHFLLIRMIAKGMVMWDNVQPTKEWLMGQIPQSLVARVAPLQSGQARLHDDAYELAYYHLVAGCCFVLGLKYAGTASQDAYSVIMDQYETVAKLVLPIGAHVYDDKIRRAALREGLNQISLALCMVMAGTADITVLRLIRYAYGVFQNNMYHVNFRYGVHVATMQSLGLLGLGGGRMTLGTSDAAIACMVAAFFPRQHVSPFDNKCYLQALRHLWVLAVEPRCLVARDVDTGEVVYLPVKVTIKDGERVGVSTLLSPTLIPSIEKVIAVRVDTPRYWPFYLDISQDRHRDALIRNQTLYVKRRTAFLSYVEDPRGSRSLFVRSGTGSGEGQILDFPKTMAAPVKNRDRDLSQFITSFSNNVIFLAFADALCRSEDEDATEQEKAFHSYAHATLLDCIMQDKPRTLQSHLSLYYTRYASPKASNFNMLYQDLKFATAFYIRVYGKYANELAHIRREPLPHVRPGLMRETQLFGAVLRMDAQLDEVRTSEKFMRLLGRYVRNEPVRLKNAQGAVEEELTLERMLAWYLLKNCVPNPEVMTLLRESMMALRETCLQAIGGDSDLQKAHLLDVGLKEAAHGTGTKMMSSSAGWSARSLDEVFRAWEMPR